VIVDCHAHLLPPRRMRKLLEWQRRHAPEHPVPVDVTLETLLAEYAAAGVDRVWNFAHALFPDESGPLNDWNHALGRSDPRVVPFGTCHPRAPDPDGVIERCLGEHGFVGMKFHPFVQRFVPWEAPFLRLLERIARGGPRILVFHTGFEAFYGGALPIGGFAEVLRAAPEAPVVLAHAGYPDVAGAFELVGRYANCHVDTVHVLAAVTTGWDPGSQQAAWQALREGIAAFPERILFGTDHPAGTGTLAAMYADARAFGLPPDVERLVLGENARRLVAAIRPG
jgi:uncharacterized protein